MAKHARCLQVWPGNRARQTHPFCGQNTKRKLNLQSLRLISWNVRTLTDRDDSSRPERRTALVAMELARYNIDVAALSETRLADEGQISETGAGYTFFWKGKTAEEPRLHGVGFAIRNSLVRMHNLLPVHVSERITTLRIPLQHGHVTIVSVYAPTLDSEVDVKESFYASLRTTLSAVPLHDKLLLMGDFNARVGKDHQLWHGVIGNQGIGSCNANGLLLLGLCAEFNLCITNTIFRLRTRDKTSWMHPRSRQWHLIDYVITRRKDLGMVLITKALRGADDCWTDHRPIFSSLRIRLKPKPRLHANPPRKKFDVSALKDPDTSDQFRSSLSQRLLDANHDTSDPEASWCAIKNAINSTARETIGFVKRRHQDWFDENNLAIRDLIDQKRRARLAWENQPTSKNKEAAFRKIKATAQRTIRKLQNDWWIEKAKEIQGYADRHETRNFFQAVRTIYGPTHSSSHPLSSADGQVLLKEEVAILTRWKEHFEDLLNRPSQATEDFLREIPQHPIQSWMSLPPSLEETREAIKQMKPNKASGPDSIPVELIQHGGDCLLSQIHLLFLSIWETKHVPQDLRDASIVTIFKKGDRSACGNYRGISLLSITGKIFARVLHKRLHDLSESVLPESQYGFRPGRGTTEMTFCARQLLEKAREQQQPMTMIFFDLYKAFDSVPRAVLWGVLEKFGCPQHFVQLVQGLHDGMMGSVIHGASTSPSFPIATGVKQGCVLAPTLFSLYLAAVLLRVNTSHPHLGVRIRYRMDGGLFNLRRLKARSRTSEVSISELQYADDSCVPASSPADLQESTDAFVEAYESAGLEVNVGKTKVLAQSHPAHPLQPFDISIHGNSVEQVSRFCYLGSMINNTNDPNEDINNRIRSAHQAFGKLYHRVFSQHGLSAQTKIGVYRAVVIPTLLFGSECWTLYRKNIRTLERFHQQKLRAILGIAWEERVTNNDVLTRAGLPSMEATIAKNQLRFLGHLYRREDSSLPKQTLFCELAHGSRLIGGPKRRLKDQHKQLFKKTRIPVDNWEALAADRESWRGTIANGVQKLEADRAQAAEAKRQQRKQRLLLPRPPPTLPCPDCPRLFYSHLGLHSHQQAHRRRDRLS